MGLVSDIAHNLRIIRDTISQTALACGRTSDEVTLLAVSKTFPVEVISQAIAAGQLKFGENRVQEAEPKIQALHDQPGLEWHLVGHLQSNKARRAAELFEVVHSVDSIKLAAKLSEAAFERGKLLSGLIEVKLGDEESKFGVVAGGVGEILSACRGFPGIRIDGLMTIPPFFENNEMVRPFFAELRRLRDSLEREEHGCLGKGHLSMGMSHDFVEAIQEGSTIVRVGTAIFGERRYE